MSVAALSKLTPVAALGLFLASACGGNSFSGHDDPKGGAASGGTNSAAGTPAQGGSSASGGAASAGTASGGMASAGAGSGGPACNAPPESGNCDAALERWFHDTATGLCRSFIYGGCGGNPNNYETFEACQKACPGGSPNFDACSAPTDCMVTGGGCCGVCDGPDLLARDLVAINKKHALELQQCAFLTAPPGDVACVPCPAITAETGSLRYFVADCVQSQCVVVDVRTSALSSCQADSDCRVRNGNDCCESCSASEPIAINHGGAFEKLVCGATPPGCPECEPAASGAVAFCGASGHCELAYAEIGAR